MYSPFRHVGSVIWKRSPIHLTFFLTRRCNARCPYCFYLANNHNPEKNLPELSLNEIEKTSASLDSLLWLAFSGGEIFLRNDIVDITRIFYERNRPAVILFSTNGLLTDVIKEKIEAILKYCRKSTIVVKLSIDGTEELHDSMRGVKGSFQKTMQTYNALGMLIDKNQNLELGINTVFCSENQDNMEELIGFVNGLDKIKTHTVSLIRGNIKDTTWKEIDNRSYLEIIKKMESNLKNRRAVIYRFRGARLKAAQDILQRRYIYKTLLQRKQLIPCYAGRLNLVLTETGDLYPCESFTIRLGNIRDNGYDIRKILKTEHVRKAISSIRNNGCYCTHECYFMTNILFNPRMFPALLWEYLQL